jgi:DNA helicase-2/ATP-dependent DNA helicase PcrA
MSGGDLSRAVTDVADVSARRAIDAPADAPLLAIVGRAASGKTETLARRYVTLLARDPTLAPAATIVTAATAHGAGALAARIDALMPGGGARLAGRYVGTGLDRLAFDVLAENAALGGLAYDIEEIDAYDSEEIFGRAIAPLFSTEWTDFLGPDIDPEIPGLRAPDRFATAVLRLIRKLRDAQIAPAAFLKAAQVGATEFYANPPNLCAPALLFATKDEHRASLAVGSAELERQRRRELDLAKIIAKIYRAYIDALTAHRCLTPSDAIAEATSLLEEHPAVARTYRTRFRIALVDDAHDIATGEFRLLSALFGKTLAGVTIAGDPDAATQTFAGARPERVFAAATTKLELQAGYRVPAQVAAVIDALLDPAGAAAPLPPGDAVQLHRASTAADEIAFVAAAVAQAIAAGTPPGRVAVLHRSLRTLGPFEDALVDRNVPVALRGDAALFARHDTLDALALLWATVDPFAHAWLLRALQLPPLGCADATLAVLCGEPANPQAALFDLPPEAGDGTRRWDRRRDLRLGTNVVRGDRDADLEPDVRERLAAFRERRARWQRLLGHAGVAHAARTILTEGGAYAARTGETAARTRRRAVIVDALVAMVSRYAGRRPGDDLAAALAYCDRIARSESGPVIDDRAADAVVVAAIDRVKSERFEHVFVVDVRAGSFPPYYVPDAFLFSQTYGMIPKDSVGEAVTARTAKFTWYAHAAKLRDAYAREDRRALAVAFARADRRVTVSAAGRPTRGVAAPELLLELQTLRPALPNAPPPSAGGPMPRGEPPPPAPEPAPNVAAAAGPDDTAGCFYVAADRVVGMTRCVRCAPRRTIAASIAGSFTLLSGRLPGSDPRVEQRDVTFAFALGGAVVFGSVPALVRHSGGLHVAIAGRDEMAAALAMHALSARVVQDNFFTELADGVFEGPHTIEVSNRVTQAADVLSGTVTPLCQEHRNP